MAGPVADQRHRRFIEKDAFGHHLLLQQRDRRSTISISLAENDVGWVIVAVNADVGEFEANAGQHHEFDAIDFDLTAQAGFELLKEEVFEDVDAEQLARIKEDEYPATTRPSSDSTTVRGRTSPILL